MRHYNRGPVVIRRPFSLSSLTDLIVARIRESGPITVAEFMELALYHPQLGYYMRAPQRSGRAGDFFTSVDVGPLFGELIAVQLAEMWSRLRDGGASRFQLVEAAAGNGRLTRDILDAASARHHDLYEHLSVTLVERSAAAGAAQRGTLGDLHRASLQVTTPELPERIDGVILANELLDALPVHVVARTDKELREVYVDTRDGRLHEIEGPLSTPAIHDYIRAVGVAPPIGTRAEIGLRAVEWMRCAATALERGFLLLFDYGHHASQLFSATHADGTLASYRTHCFSGSWLEDPGEGDLTAHVNLTAIQHAAEQAGLETLGIVDQSYFLTALGLTTRLDAGTDRAAVARRLAAKTLVMPGGLGSTMKVMIFTYRLGHPRLTGLSSGRLT